MTGEVKVLFPETGSAYYSITERLGNFVDNSHVSEFTASEKRALIENLGELKKMGLNGILHIVHRGSPTGILVQNSIPREIINRGFYHQLHYVTTRDDIFHNPAYRDYVNANRTCVIIVGEDGSISDRDQTQIRALLRDNVGIILGGGPGSPKDAAYRPLLTALDEPIVWAVPHIIRPESEKISI